MSLKGKKHGNCFSGWDDSDFEFLFRFYSRPYHKPDFTKKLVKLYLNYYFVKLVEVDNEVVGILIWYARESPRLGWAEILDLWIDENHRRKDTGLRLLQSAIEDIKSYYYSEGFEARCIIVFTSENNLPARKLYEKFGFKKVGYGGYIAKDGTRELLYALNL
jgi:ribosomal protein S18 acetylase RimI-like enzyme